MCIAIDITEYCLPSSPFSPLPTETEEEAFFFSSSSLQPVFSTPPNSPAT